MSEPESLLPNHVLHFVPTEDDLRKLRNEEFRREVTEGQQGGLIARAGVTVIKVGKLTATEWADHEKVLRRGLDEDRCGGTVSDVPLLAKNLAKLTGSKSRNNFQNFIKKGLSHSYGKGKGVVSALIYEVPPEGCIEWYALSDFERRVLQCFDGRTWCCRPKSYEQEARQHASWRKLRLLPEPAGLTGRGIADALELDLLEDQHLRATLAKLVKLGLLVSLSVVRGNTRATYLPNPAKWPFRALSMGHCPAIDRVNRWRREHGRSRLPHDLTSHRRQPRS